MSRILGVNSPEIDHLRNFWGRWMTQREWLWWVRPFLVCIHAFMKLVCMVGLIWCNSTLVKILDSGRSLNDVGRHKSTLKNMIHDWRFWIKIQSPYKIFPIPLTPNMSNIVPLAAPMPLCVGDAPLLSLVVVEGGTLNLEVHASDGWMFTTPTKGEGKLWEGALKIMIINVKHMHFYFRKFNFLIGE